MESAHLGSANPVEIPEFKNGDYIVFQNNGLYVMYHMSDHKLWRTEAHELDKMMAEDSEPVQGIQPIDGMSRVIMSGHEEVQIAKDMGKAAEVPELPPEIDPDAISPDDIPEEERAREDVSTKELPPLEDEEEPLPDEITDEFGGSEDEEEPAEDEFA